MAHKICVISLSFGHECGHDEDDDGGGGSDGRLVLLFTMMICCQRGYLYICWTYLNGNGMDRHRQAQTCTRNR